MNWSEIMELASSLLVLNTQEILKVTDGNHTLSRIPRVYSDRLRISHGSIELATIYSVVAFNSQPLENLPWLHRASRDLLCRRLQFPPAACALPDPLDAADSAAALCQSWVLEKSWSTRLGEIMVTQKLLLVGETSQLKSHVRRLKYSHLII
jgi:hypothetical protein